MIEAKSLTYKSTNWSWMPHIPENWETRRAKAIFQERSIKGFPDEPLLAASQKQGVVLKEMLEQRSMEAIQNFESFKLVEKDDFVISLRSFEGGIELAYYRGIISPVYSIFYFRENKHNRDFFKYLFKSRMFIQELNVYKKGIRDGQSINFSEFANIYLPVPPQHEQDEIVQYIKAQEEKINLFIQKKQRFIELLKEQRQTIITNAITKGVDVNTKSKNSRVEWLGDVPAHWRIVRLKFLGESFIGLTYSPVELVDKEDGIFVLRSSNIQNGKFTTEDNVYVNKEIPEKLILKKGDILLCSRNGSAELIGKNILIDDESAGNTFGAFMTVFRSTLNYYLYYFFNSNVFKSQTSLFATSTINQLTNSILSNLTIAYPESFDEQMRIIEHIKTETATIDTAIAKAEREVELIREYKEAMIAEAVMGKRNSNFEKI